MVRPVVKVGLSALVVASGNSKLAKVIELLGKMVAENTHTMEEEQVGFVFVPFFWKILGFLVVSGIRGRWMGSGIGLCV